MLLRRSSWVQTTLRGRCEQGVRQTFPIRLALGSRMGFGRTESALGPRSCSDDLVNSLESLARGSSPQRSCYYIYEYRKFDIKIFILQRMLVVDEDWRSARSGYRTFNGRSKSFEANLSWSRMFLPCDRSLGTRDASRGTFIRTTMYIIVIVEKRS